MQQPPLEPNAWGRMARSKQILVYFGRPCNFKVIHCNLHQFWKSISNP